MDRNVASSCSFKASEAIAIASTSPLRGIDHFNVAFTAGSGGGRPSQNNHAHVHAADKSRSRHRPISDIEDSVPAPSLSSSSRLIQDAKGKHMFIGESANLSFLQSIREVVSSMVGPCPFVDDPLKYLMVEAIPDDHPSSTTQCPMISLSKATSLVRFYNIATSCVLDLFDESDLLDGLPLWLEGLDFGNAKDRDPNYFLVLAIGAQTSPDDEDELAVAFFEYGRHLAASRHTEDPSIATVQIYSMITFYLLGASRRNAAFMNLGLAVRAAYAIGLHREDVATLFHPKEYETRERGWRVIRILDLFMSASLGRPPSTAETRDTSIKANYSASVDLCALFELILNEVYSKRSVTAEATRRIRDHHCAWSARFRDGLLVDHVSPETVLPGCNIPNIGLLHIKEAYYWTIMLFTRPFLLEYITLQAPPLTSAYTRDPSDSPGSASTEGLAYACVDSAVRTIDLLYVFRTYERTPRRLPFVVNSIFVSTLVIGAASFTDFHRYFPLDRTLTKGKELLDLFSTDDIARRDSAIIGQLQLACSSYREDCRRKEAQKSGKHVERMFGQIHKQHRERGEVRPVEGSSLEIQPERAAELVMNDVPTGSGEILGVQDLSAFPPTENDMWNWSGVPEEHDYNFGVDIGASFLVMSPRTFWFD
ncbi:hypothetical protein VTL71DRAFT_3053 [Oculimacula yallundae]|uniref:Xylanolytic transcriptional activator regulatory domain-containing protein n=1 Tax=Oculimacula yallundae TaxID=86028 RepID=A0ABR4C626_9HELO